MSLDLTSLEKQFANGNFIEKWKETIQDAGFSVEIKNELLNWVQEKWKTFLSLAQPVNNEEELRQLIVNQYIELKSHWIMHNTSIQYQNFFKGTADEKQMYQSTLLSDLVNFFGEYLANEELDLINRLLVEPIETEIADIENMEATASDLDQKVFSMEEQLKDLYSQRDELKQAIGVADADEIIFMVRSLDMQLQDLYQEKETESRSAAEDKQVPEAVSSLEMQLSSLYEEREQLQKRIGTADVDSIIQMIESMDEQLQSLYNDLENAVVIEGQKITIMGPRKVIVRKKTVM